jgi:hypothetical protein
MIKSVTENRRFCIKYLGISITIYTYIYRLHDTLITGACIAQLVKPRTLMQKVVSSNHSKAWHKIGTQYWPSYCFNQSGGKL